MCGCSLRSRYVPRAGVTTYIYIYIYIHTYIHTYICSHTIISFGLLRDHSALSMEQVKRGALDLRDLVQKDELMAMGVATVPYTTTATHGFDPTMCAYIYFQMVWLDISARRQTHVHNKYTYA